MSTIKNNSQLRLDDSDFTLSNSSFQHAPFKVCVIGGGLAGCEAALMLASRDINVTLYEMRPVKSTEVHAGDNLAELVCSNSFKSEKYDSAAGMLKQELEMLGSNLYKCALNTRVDAGGALAVNRELFSAAVEDLANSFSNLNIVREEISDINELSKNYDAAILATGPLTSDVLSQSLIKLTGEGMLAFYDAAAPIVYADSLNMDALFRQDRYGENNNGDYLNSPLDKQTYEMLIKELVSAQRVIAKDFEQKELFQACQPIEELAKGGLDAARFGPMKPVGLINPSTGKRPWAAIQLRAEDRNSQSYNIVGFQTNLTFTEQQRIFRMIPGFESAEFARFGVMHRNTFLDAPSTLDNTLRLVSNEALMLDAPIYIAGQLSGTEGYTEAIRSGIHAAISVWCHLNSQNIPIPTSETVFGALIAHATNSDVKNYQPMHVNFGIISPLDKPQKNKKERYKMYAERGRQAMLNYIQELKDVGFL